MKNLFSYITEGFNTSELHAEDNVVLFKQNSFRVLIGYKYNILKLLSGHEDHDIAKKILKNPSFNRVANDQAVVQIGFRNSNGKIKLIRIAKRKESSVEEVVSLFKKRNELGIRLFTDFQCFGTDSYEEYAKFVETEEPRYKFDKCNPPQAEYYMIRQDSVTILFTSKENLEKLFKGSSNSVDRDILKHPMIVQADPKDIFKLSFYLGCEYGIPQGYYIDSAADSYMVNYAMMSNQGRKGYEDLVSGKIHNQDLPALITDMHKSNYRILDYLITKSLTLDEFRHFILIYEYKK